MHWMTASLLPLMVTALSVLFGNISLATCTLAPVTSRISFILLPPLPIRDPHWLAGTISLKVIGGFGTPGEVIKESRSSSNLAHIRVKALRMLLLVPVTVTILSGQAPSVILIFAPLWNNLENQNKFNIQKIKYLIPLLWISLQYLLFYQWYFQLPKKCKNLDLQLFTFSHSLI